MTTKISTLLALVFALTTGLSCSSKKEKGGSKGEGKAKTKKWAKADFARLSKLQIPGLTLIPSPIKPPIGTLNYYAGKKNTKGVFPSVSVLMQGCMGCSLKKMGDLAAWKKMLPSLNMTLSKAEKDDPKLVNELKEMDLRGIKAMTLYTKSFVKTKNGKRSHHSLDVYYNNGVNEVKISVSAKTKPFKMVNSLKELEEAMTKTEMVKAASAALKAVAKEM